MARFCRRDATAALASTGQRAIGQTPQRDSADMDLTFNIIFVPGMVRYLRLAVLSLLDHSDFRFRLVSNGLPRDELILLQQFCLRCPRLEFLGYPTPAMLPHGTLLTLLEHREHGEHFCFMDPDIFATGPFQPELERRVRDCDVFSSCRQLVVDPNDIPTGYNGANIKTPTGLDLATSFLAVYRGELLRRVIAAEGVAFEHFPHPATFPPGVAARLAARGLNPERCDTGKLLNILMHDHQVRFQYSPLEGLHHIGGIAAFFRDMQGPSLRDRIGRLFKRPSVLRDVDVGAAGAKVATGTDCRAADTTEKLRWKQHAMRRTSVARFFACFLQSLFDGAPEPGLSISDASLRERIMDMCHVLREVHGRHASSLVA